MSSLTAAQPPYNVIQPGGYSAIDSSLLTNPSPAPAAPIPVALGVTLGGQPDTPLYFNSAGALQAALRGGPGYDLARFMLGAGANKVCVVRVGNSITQASLPLGGTGGTGAANTVVTLTAKDWGSWANSILITVTTGPVITLQYTNQFGVVFTEQWDLTSITTLTAATIVDAINGQLYGYNASQYVTATAGPGALPLTNISQSPLVGGSDGSTPAAGDWTNGLTALETEQVSVLVPATGDPSIHAQVLAHCQQMSLPNTRRERTMRVGGVLGETVSQAIARQTALADARESVTYPGCYDYNAQGKLTLYDPFYTAAKLAGMSCALPDVATSLVHAAVPIVAAEVDLSTVSGGALDQLLFGGVTPVAKADTGGYWVVDDITGYTGSDKTFRDVNSVRSADFVAQYLRVNLQSAFVGSKGGITATSSSIEAKAQELCDQLVAMKVIVAYGAPTASLTDANGFSVIAPVQLVNTTKFIFITESLQPGTAQTGITSNS